MSGYLQPDLTVFTEPLEGKALHEFVQGWVVGITGLAGDLVRPRWQAEPADVPTAGTCWASIGIATSSADEFPAVRHDQSGYDYLLTHETVTLLASFYDLGYDGEARYYAARLRDGIYVEQNRWPLDEAGWGVVSVGNLTSAPTLVKQRWYTRVDVEVELSREVRRAYPVPDVAVARGTLDALAPGTTIAVTGTIAAG